MGTRLFYASASKWSGEIFSWLVMTNLIHNVEDDEQEQPLNSHGHLNAIEVPPGTLRYHTCPKDTKRPLISRSIRLHILSNIKNYTPMDLANSLKLEGITTQLFHLKNRDPHLKISRNQTVVS